MQYVSGTVPVSKLGSINDTRDPMIKTQASNDSIFNDNIPLLNSQIRRLGILCMSLWYWVSSGITYFGIIIADDHDLPNTIQILFYLSLCAVTLMIGGIISTAIPNPIKCIKYTSGIMWLLSGLLMIAVVIWTFHMNYNDPDWRSQHSINNYSPTLYFMATLARYLPVIFIAMIIAMEIMFNFGAKHLYFTIKLFAFVIFATSMLWMIPLFKQYEGDSTAISIIMKISYMMVAITSFSICAIFVFIDRLQHLSFMKYAVIICMFLLNVFGAMTQPIEYDGNAFSIFSQNPSGQLHSNFVWRICLTYMCYMVMLANNNIFNKNTCKTSRGRRSINDHDPFNDYSMSINLHSLNINLENNEVQSNESMGEIKENSLNERAHRLGLYCLCLWYWIIPDLLQYGMIPQDGMSTTQTFAVNLMITAFVVDFASILGVGLYLVSNTQRLSWIVALFFVIGGVLMFSSRLVTYSVECHDESSIDSVEQSYCGLALMSTHLIGALLPIFIATEFIVLPQYVRRLFRVFIVFVISLLWTIVVYRYDVDVDYGDLLDPEHEKFRSDIQSVVRTAWTLIPILCVMMAIIVILKRFERLKGKAISSIVVVLFLIANGMAVIDDYGGEIAQNPLTQYPKWTAAFPFNSYWTLFSFSFILCYDVLSA